MHYSYAYFQQGQVYIGSRSFTLNSWPGDEWAVIELESNPGNLPQSEFTIEASWLPKSWYCVQL